MNIMIMAIIKFENVYILFIHKFYFLKNINLYLYAFINMYLFILNNFLKYINTFIYKGYNFNFSEY